MGKTIIDDLKIKEEFTAPISDFNDGKNWYKTWNDQVLVVGNVYKINNEFCVYAGDFKTKEEVPKSFCCYTIGDTMRVRHTIINDKAEIPLRERRKKTEDDRVIDTTSKDTDNTLMVLIKSALQHKNISRGDFRRIYPNLSDMNNILRCIEKGDTLSWGRFNDILEKLDMTYSLSIFDENKEIINKA
jgi:hypothetical protein